MKLHKLFLPWSPLWLALAIAILVYTDTQPVHGELCQVSCRKLFHCPDYRSASRPISGHVAFTPEKLPTRRSGLAPRYLKQPL
jgi:hypothetical protein